jgi:hypothetical protein
VQKSGANVRSGSNLPVPRRGGKVWNRRISVGAGYSGDGLFTEPIAVAQPWRRDPLFVPPFPTFAPMVSNGSVGWIFAVRSVAQHRKPLSHSWRGENRLGDRQPDGLGCPHRR